MSTSFGLSLEVLEKIEHCLQKFPELLWVRVYGSRAKGNYETGSDIDLAFSSNTDVSASLLAALDALATPYLFDVTHYETIDNSALKEHIYRVGILIYKSPQFLTPA